MLARSKDLFPTVVILAGGKGMRLREETDGPKPLIEIGGIPVVVHIIRWFESFGHQRFIICGGYKAELLQGCWIGHTKAESEISCLATGDSDDIGTAGRLLRARKEIGPEAFLVTYGDSLADVDLDALAATHAAARRTVTMTVVRPRIPFGLVTLGTGDTVIAVREKPTDLDLWSNGGIFGCEPSFFDALASESEYFERRPLEQLAAAGDIQAYRHEGFRLPIDTPKDLSEARDIWERGDAPWSVKDP
jgi:glucose-1-phosphate cytidylyltransferase